MKLPDDRLYSADGAPDKAMVYDLTWVDMAYSKAPADAPLSDFERKRRFLHLGAAISWSRRRIFKGEVFDHVVELQKVRIRPFENAAREIVEYRESIDDLAVIEIRLDGFQTWDRKDDYYGDGKSQTVRKLGNRCPV